MRLWIPVVWRIVYHRCFVVSYFGCAGKEINFEKAEFAPHSPLAALYSGELRSPSEANININVNTLNIYPFGPMAKEDSLVQRPVFISEGDENVVLRELPIGLRVEVQTKNPSQGNIDFVLQIQLPFGILEGHR